jgi:hypothetical protein
MKSINNSMPLTPTQEELNSNNLNTKIRNVCSDCGIEANRLTCLKKYGQEPLKKCFDVSTFHKGKCDWCGKLKHITQTRDFFYPDFNLLPDKTENK